MEAAAPIRIFPKSSKVFIMVVFAGLVYVMASHLIFSHIVQYSDHKQTSMLIMKYNEKTMTSAGQYVTVKSKLKIDAQKPLPLNPKELSAKKLDKYQPKTDDVLFHQNPVFLVWAILVCIMVTFAAGSFAFFLMKIADLKQKFVLTPCQVAIGAIYALALGALLMYTGYNTPGVCQPVDVIDQFHILLTNGSIITLIVAVTIFFILPGLAVIFLIAKSSDNIYIGATNDINGAKDNLKSIEEAAAKVAYLNSLLQIALQILSAIIVLAVLSANTLGLSIKNTIEVSGYDLYPKQLSYVYGLSFTLFLSIIYVPVYMAMKNNYHSLKELAANTEGIGTDSDLYKKFFTEPKFATSSFDNLKSALAVVAPLLTGIVQTFGNDSTLP